MTEQQAKQAKLSEVDSFIKNYTKEYQRINEAFERQCNDRQHLKNKLTIYLDNKLVTIESENHIRSILSHMAQDTYEKIQEHIELYNNLNA